LKFRLLGFPVAIQPFFFVTAFFIGPRNDPWKIALWIIAVATGILIHEMGHALVARRFGFDPMIVLHGFGGQTSFRPGRDFSTMQKIGLSAAGPAMGIFVGAGLVLLRHIVPATGTGLTGEFLNDAIWVNLGWGILNLLPVLPLDGGQIASALAGALFGKAGRMIAVGISSSLTIALVLWAVWKGELWLTILGIILTASNIGKLVSDRKVKKPSLQMTDALKSYDLARSLALAGKNEEALKWLETALLSGMFEGRMLDSDPAWANLRNDPRFVTLRRRMTINVFPENRTNPQ